MRYSHFIRRALNAIGLLVLIGTGSAALAEDQLQVAQIDGANVPSAVPGQDDHSSQNFERVESLLLSFEVNGEAINRFDLVYVAPGDRAYVRAALLEHLRLVPPPRGNANQMIGGEFRPVSDIPGLRYTIDRQALLLKIECEARCFALTEVSARRRLVDLEPTRVGVGGFLNYDVNIQRISGAFDVSTLTELGLFSDQGSFVTTIAAQDLSNSANFLRLESSFTVDDLQNRRRLVLGDSVSRSASWSQPVRYAGVRYGNEFSLTPGFVTLPTPDFSGEAALPSTIDVFVNGVRRFTGDVPPGPFAVRDIPVLTGTGEALVIVRDVLGREQVFTEAYATSREMLRAGLVDWSVSAGFLRDEFARVSNDYGSAFISGLYAKGLSDQVTFESFGQLSADVRTIGAGAAYAAGAIGVFNIRGAFASVNVDDGQPDRQGHDRGHLFGMGWDWSRGRVSFNADYEQASARFRTVGQTLSNDADKHRFRVNGSISMRGSSVSMGYVDLKRRDGDDFSSINAKYATRLFRNVSLTINGFRQLSPNRSDNVSLFISAPLGGKAIGGLSADKERGGGYSISATAQRNPDFDGGFGYRLRVGQDEADRFSDGLLRYLGDAVDASIGWSSAVGRTQMRGTLRGGVVMAEGYVRPARYVTESFAIVDLADQPDVGIYADRRLIGKTDSRGVLVVSNLRPFQKNLIGLEAADLPLDWPIAELEYEVVPSNRTGHLVKIVGGNGRSATFNLKLVDGNAPPVGSALAVDGHDANFFVGENGFVYVAGLMEQRSSAHVSWIGGSCRVEIVLPNSDIPQAMLGDITCR